MTSQCVYFTRRPTVSCLKYLLFCLYFESFLKLTFHDHVKGLLCLPSRVTSGAGVLGLVLGGDRGNLQHSARLICRVVLDARGPGPPNGHLRTTDTVDECFRVIRLVAEFLKKGTGGTEC